MNIEHKKPGLAKRGGLIIKFVILILNIELKKKRFEGGGYNKICLIFMTIELNKPGLEGGGVIIKFVKLIMNIELKKPWLEGTIEGIVEFV